MLNGTNRFVIVAMVGVLVAPVAVRAGTLIDNFESYKKGLKIGASYDSSPWLRFGNATNDNIVVTTDSTKVIEGRKSAQYGLFWPNKFGAARFQYAEKSDLTEFTKVHVKVKSSHTGTTTTVKLAISDGVATYHSRKDYMLTDQAQQLTFSLLESDMVLVDGKGSFEESIQNVSNIGLDFKSTSGQYIEVVVFDDFELEN